MTRNEPPCPTGAPRELWPAATPSSDDMGARRKRARDDADEKDMVQNDARRRRSVQLAIEGADRTYPVTLRSGTCDAESMLGDDRGALTGLNVTRLSSPLCLFESQPERRVQLKGCWVNWLDEWDAATEVPVFFRFTTAAFDARGMTLPEFVRKVNAAIFIASSFAWQTYSAENPADFASNLPWAQHHFEGDLATKDDDTGILYRRGDPRLPTNPNGRVQLMPPESRNAWWMEELAYVAPTPGVIQLVGAATFATLPNGDAVVFQDPFDYVGAALLLEVTGIWDPVDPTRREGFFNTSTQIYWPGANFPEEVELSSDMPTRSLVRVLATARLSSVDHEYHHDPGSGGTKVDLSGPSGEPTNYRFELRARAPLAPDTFPISSITEEGDRVRVTPRLGAWIATLRATYSEPS